MMNGLDHVKLIERVGRECVPGFAAVIGLVEQFGDGPLLNVSALLVSRPENKVLRVSGILSYLSRHQVRGKARILSSIMILGKTTSKYN